MNPERKLQIKTYTFRGKVWRYKGQSSWHFATLPKSLASNIRMAHKSTEEGWGRLKVIAQIKKTRWETSIWFDSKANSYLLPIKGPVRKSENLAEGDPVYVRIEIEKSSPFSVRSFYQDP